MLRLVKSMAVVAMFAGIWNMCVVQANILASIKILNVLQNFSPILFLKHDNNY